MKVSSFHFIEYKLYNTVIVTKFCPNQKGNKTVVQYTASPP